MISSKQKNLINKLFYKLPASDDKIRNLYEDIKREEREHRKFFNNGTLSRYGKKTMTITDTGKYFTLDYMLKGFDLKINTIAVTDAPTMKYEDILFLRITYIKGIALGIRHYEKMHKNIDKKDIEEFKNLEYSKLIENEQVNNE